MAIMTSDVFSTEFTTTQLRRVYDDNEVDEFLDQIVVELRRLTTDNDELRALIPPDALDKVAAARASAENIEKDAAARIAKANAEAEAAEAGAAERARSATEGADEIANSAVTAGARAADEIGGAPAAGLSAAAGLLALAQQLHDEYVSEGKAKHDALIAEADELLAKANVERQNIITEARERSTGMVTEAQQKRAEVFQTLGHERGLLQKKIEELRNFERDQRAHLQSYLEGQLIKLDQTEAAQTEAARSDLDQTS